jgi:hypothetical protein
MERKCRHHLWKRGSQRFTKNHSLLLRLLVLFSEQIPNPRKAEDKTRTKRGVVRKRGFKGTILNWPWAPPSLHNHY